MKKIIIIICIVFTLASCKSNIEMKKFDITEIEVFYIPFDITSPVQSDELPLRKIPSFKISNSQMINEIIDEIKILSKSGLGDKINKNSLYLICDFYEKNDKAFTLMFDKNIININGNDYNESQVLIDLLIKNNAIKLAILVALRKTKNPILLKVKSNQAFRKGIHFYREAKGVWLSDRIASSFIERIEIK